MNRRKIVIISVAIAIVALGVVVFKLQTASKKTDEKQNTFDAFKYVNAIDANYSDYQSEIVAFGRLLPLNKIEIFSEVGGVMMETPKKFKVGNNFSKGELLIKIDNEEAKLSLYAAKSSFMNLLTTSMADVKSDFPADYNLWKNYLDNFNIESKIPDLPKVSDNKLKYFLSNKQIFSQYYNIKNSEVKLSKYQIYAPFDGSIITSLAEPGTFIRQGQKVGDLSSYGTYELELNVISSDVQFFNVGDQVEITSTELDGVWTGRIIRIAKNIDQNTQSVKVYVAVSGNTLREGLYMKAIIKGIPIKNAVKVPRKALVNNEFVFTINNDKLEKTKIELVKLTEYDAYIRGIEQSKLVVTEAPASAEVGMPVKRINNQEIK